MSALNIEKEKRFSEWVCRYLDWYIERKTDKSKKIETSTGKGNDFYLLRQKAFHDRKAIAEFPGDPACPEDPDMAATFVQRLDHCIVDRFFLVAIKKDTIHLLHSTDDDLFLLQVTPSSQEALLNMKLFGTPNVVEAALFPADTTIVYDMLITYPICLGASIRKNIREDTAKAKARHGIITVLPIPVADEDKDLVLLRGLMVSISSIRENWNQIQDIIENKPEFTGEYYQKLGAAYIRDRKKDRKKNAIFGWFALYGWMVIAGGKTREIAESAARTLVPEEHFERLVFFEVRK